MPPTARRQGVIVSGHAASGKTTLAAQLAEALAIPLVSKDAILVKLVSTQHVPDVETASRLGAQAWESMFQIATDLMGRHPAVIIEGPFDPSRAKEQIARLQLDAVVEVFCRCSLEVTLKRFADRQRHPGHFDHLHVAHPERWLIPGHARSEPLRLGPVLALNTNDFVLSTPKR